MRGAELLTDKILETTFSIQQDLRGQGDDFRAFLEEFIFSSPRFEILDAARQDESNRRFGLTMQKGIFSVSSGFYGGLAALIEGQEAWYAICPHQFGFGVCSDARLGPGNERGADE
jgi:hypothetical protein